MEENTTKKRLYAGEVIKIIENIKKDEYSKYIDKLFNIVSSMFLSARTNLVYYDICKLDDDIINDDKYLQRKVIDEFREYGYKAEYIHEKPGGYILELKVTI